MKKRFLQIILAVFVLVTCVESPTLGVRQNSADYSVSAAEISYFNSSFDSDVDNWAARGSAVVSVSEGAGINGTAGLSVTGRTDVWNGAEKALSSDFVAGNAYSFSVWVKSTKTTSDNFKFTLQYTLEETTNYEEIASDSATGGKWVLLENTNFTIPLGAESLSVYVEMPDSATGSFYMDEALGATAGTSNSSKPDSNPSQAGKQGDVNNDNKVNIADVEYLTAYLLNSDSEYRETLNEKNADLDENVVIDAFDLAALKRKILTAPVESDFDYDPSMVYHEAPGNYFDNCSQAGQIITETYNGINGGNTLKVYLPYGYDESQEYNIFYLMHGGGESENTIFGDDVKLGQMLDHMIMNGELEPLIVVTPTFTKAEAQTFYKEFRASVIPFVEGKYSTYAESTSAEDIAASRMHRAYGGFSMGSASTWAVLVNCLDIVGYYMPLSGENWEVSGGGYDKAKSVADAVDRSELEKNEYFIFCATGSEDIAYPNMNPQMDEMKKMEQFIYTSDFSQGNFYYLVAPDKTHWWGYVRHYVYDALPYFFHEGQ